MLLQLFSSSSSPLYRLGICLSHLQVSDQCLISYSTPSVLIVLYLSLLKQPFITHAFSMLFSSLLSTFYCFTNVICNQLLCILYHHVITSYLQILFCFQFLLSQTMSCYHIIKQVQLFCKIQIQCPKPSVYLLIKYLNS